MAGNRTPRNNADVPVQIPIEITINDERKVLLEPAPEGFPPELFPHLADFWKRGFTAALVHRGDSGAHGGEEGPSLAEFAEPLSGRPLDPDVQARGRKAVALREKGLTYGKIALQLCPERTHSHHRCGGKKCADRIRQEANEYLNRKAIEDLQRGD